MKRSKHGLSNYKLLSCDMGELVPIGLTEVLPGDTIQHATSVLLRVSPLLAPVMHPVHARVHHWFVPHRIVWDDWEKFITGGPDGFDQSVFPTVEPSAPGAGSLTDYLGIPPDTDGLEISALPFRCYAKIYNEWYRDQDLIPELPISTESGPDAETNQDMQNVAWEKDYFTSSRPWTQKGPEVSLPLGDTAPVIPDGRTTFQGADSDNLAALATLNATTETHWESGQGQSENMDYISGLVTDLADATAASINELRFAFALQRYEEARARYGSRYTEYLRYLGVKSSDARLQRPEFLGGGKQTIQFSEVLATAQDNEGAGPDIAVGELKGHGIGSLRSNKYRRYFEEHGYVMSLLSVKPKTMYVQGIERHWNRRTKEDFWQKELQHIGQQEILNREIYNLHSDPEATFGFQDRYDEYRRQTSTIAGEFRGTELDFWHMARIFGSDPALNADFINSVPTKRIHAVQENDVLWIMAKHSIQARRMVTKVGTSSIF